MGYIGMAELLIILAIIFVVGFVAILPFWKIFGKAGFPAWLGVLIVIPVVNIVLLYFLAFAEWPVHQQRKTRIE